MNRTEAKNQKETYYFTEKPCKHGHLAKRFVHNGSCYECVQKASKENWRQKRTNKETRKLQIFKALKRRAIVSSIPFNLTLNDLIWPDKCPVLDIQLNYVELGIHSDFSPSFDRINPLKGYIKGNVCIISNRANRIKYNATLEELEKVVSYVKTHSVPSQLCLNHNPE